MGQATNNSNPVFFTNVEGKTLHVAVDDSSHAEALTKVAERFGLTYRPWTDVSRVPERDEEKK